ncbi:EAL domain-containing protein [Marinospirillum sp.]|uniref:EAL domain-containing protein n=1 Tax=Marinospirillum sp. TaxID=2183934 RepID=UPI00384AB01B
MKDSPRPSYSYRPIYHTRELRCLGYKLVSDPVQEQSLSQKNSYFVHLDQVLEEIKAASDQPETLQLAIKLPSVLISQKNLAFELSQLLEKHKYDKSKLLLLIKEESLSDLDVLNKALPQLASLDFQLSVDDFLGRQNTGFSALESPFIRYLRISSEVTRSALTSEAAKSYARGTVILADRLSKKVIFEGVDTEETFRLLVDIGATLAQGDYFSKPVRFEKS